MTNIKNTKKFFEHQQNKEKNKKESFVIFEQESDVNNEKFTMVVQIITDDHSSPKF
jgi:hypothetical protein